MGVLCLFLVLLFSTFSCPSSFVIVLMGKRQMLTVTVSVLLFFLVVPKVGLQCVIVVFPDHSPFNILVNMKMHSSLLEINFVELLSVLDNSTVHTATRAGFYPIF